MDLGTLISDLAGGYIQAKYGQAPVTSFVAPAATATPSVVYGPGYGPGGIAIAKKKCRRRRRRLATLSDIRDLGALKSILSPADLKTWIATHPT